MGSLTIVPSNLSFLQWITKVHFPSGTSPIPPETVYVINVPKAPSGVVTISGKSIPYGGPNFWYPQGGLGSLPAPPSPLKLTYGGGVYGAFDPSNVPSLDQFIAIMTWTDPTNSLEYCGGYYTDPAVAAAVCNTPGNIVIFGGPLTFTAVPLA